MLSTPDDYAGVEGPADRPVVTAEQMPVPVLCEYWLMCLNITVRATRHPILGSVPTCERCEAAHITLGGNPGFVIGLEDDE
jgi:hypothetical protein